MKNAYPLLLLLSLNLPHRANCQGVTAGDCDEAVSICTDHNFAITPSGFGNTDELCIGCFSNPMTNPASANAGCLLNGELNSTWFLVNVLTAGDLEFSFGEPGGGNCYDWAMWAYSSTACDDIAADSLAPIRCNWNANCQSFTGISATPLPAGGLAGDFEPPLTVGSNTQFLICFSNFSSTTTNVPLNFFGSAGISCTPLGNFSIDITGNSETGKNIINWYVGNEISNSQYVIERWEEEGSFAAIGKIAASPKEGNLKKYVFTDEEPKNGSSYYQVTQIKPDGSKVQSEIIGIEQKLSGLSILNAYPNPASHTLYLKISTPATEMAELSVIDIVGTPVSSTSLYLEEGASLIPLDIQDYKAGTYLVRIHRSTDSETKVMRFTKY